MRAAAVQAPGSIRGKETSQTQGSVGDEAGAVGTVRSGVIHFSVLPCACLMFGTLFC